ncbi:ion transporter [Magnetospirillum sp. SS-4]|uniref:ion transporter n=1 Tax=Magnetospirillum sp. SS-4 TaxID=2681465 RepID=UPI00137EFD5B|nr:ion transporter [Magnetospirillum sp. SS-4]CAA7616540.1 Ion transport protein [Magnetospirillum sp. SS-4]
MDATTAPVGVCERAGKWVESSQIQLFITVLIIINAIILGLETSAVVVAHVGPFLSILDDAILGVFIVELTLRIAYRRAEFFKDGWSLFDLAVVLIAVLPTGPGLAVLRSLRVLRVLRLITVLPRLKMIVQALLSSLPGLGMIALLQSLLFYVAAVISTKTFGEDFPEWFGSLAASLYSLFQIMTLESWSMGIVRPVMEKFPLAWVFFVPFILIATFTMLNLFIAVIVNAMQTLHEQERGEIEHDIQDIAHKESAAILAEVKDLRAEIAALRQDMQARRQD